MHYTVKSLINDLVGLENSLFKNRSTVIWKDHYPKKHKIFLWELCLVAVNTTAWLQWTYMHLSPWCVVLGKMVNLLVFFLCYVLLHLGFGSLFRKLFVGLCHFLRTMTFLLLLLWDTPSVVWGRLFGWLLFVCFSSIFRENEMAAFSSIFRENEMAAFSWVHSLILCILWMTFFLLPSFGAKIITLLHL